MAGGEEIAGRCGGLKLVGEGHKKGREVSQRREESNGNAAMRLSEAL
jgi:hypothetical protein